MVGLCFVNLFGVREAFSVVGDLPNFNLIRVDLHVVVIVVFLSRV